MLMQNLGWQTKSIMVFSEVAYRHCNLAVWDKMAPYRVAATIIITIMCLKREENQG